MGDSMHFQDNPLDFIKSYSFKDKHNTYTNGSSLIPVFRVEQMMEYYFNNQINSIQENTKLKAENEELKNILTN